MIKVKPLYSRTAYNLTPFKMYSWVKMGRDRSFHVQMKFTPHMRNTDMVDFSILGRAGGVPL